MNGLHLQHLLKFVAWFPCFSWYAELIKDLVVSYQLESTGDNMTDKTYRCHRKLASTSPICIRINLLFVEHHVLHIDHAILFLKVMDKSCVAGRCGAVVAHMVLVAVFSVFRTAS